MRTAVKEGLCSMQIHTEKKSIKLCTKIPKREFSFLADTAIFFSVKIKKIIKQKNTLGSVAESGLIRDDEKTQGRERGREKMRNKREKRHTRLHLSKLWGFLCLAQTYLYLCHCVCAHML